MDLKATSEKARTERWIIGSNETATLPYSSHLPGEMQGLNANWNQRELQLALKLNF